MPDPTPLHECTFYTDEDDERRHVGRCREWPDLTSRPRTRKLDALDDIISKVRDKLRHLHASINTAREETL